MGNVQNERYKTTLVKRFIMQTQYKAYLIKGYLNGGDGGEDLEDFKFVGVFVNYNYEGNSISTLMPLQEYIDDWEENSEFELCEEKLVLEGCDGAHQIVQIRRKCLNRIDPDEVRNIQMAKDMNMVQA